jgi:DNA-binding cell septation regulator SpoVG
VKPEDITVEMRLSPKKDSKVKAFADVTLPYGSDGVVTLLGFSVIDADGKPAHVMAPARKGKQAWFNTVELVGRVRSYVETAVLAEYERQTKNPE